MTIQEKVHPTVSVILATYYRYDCLQVALGQLQSQCYSPHEVVIIDQTPLADRPIDFYERFNDLPLKIINLDQPSLTISRNIGAQQAEGDLLLFLDDDMVFSERLVESHVEVFLEENVDVVFGAVSDLETLPKTFTRDVRRLDPISFFLKSPRCEWSGMILITSGANTLIRKEVFLKVGGFDEKMPRMEDIELGYRLFQNGAKMFYSPKPFSQHKEWQTGGSRKSQKNQSYTKLISKLYLYKKHFPGWTTRQFILREIISAMLFREYVSAKFRPKLLLQPYIPLVRLFSLGRAWAEVNKLLRK